MPQGSKPTKILPEPESVPVDWGAVRTATASQAVAEPRNHSGIRPNADRSGSVVVGSGLRHVSGPLAAIVESALAELAPGLEEGDR